jgi:hypothetical protein
MIGFKLLFPISPPLQDSYKFPELAFQDLAFFKDIIMFLMHSKNCKTAPIKQVQVLYFLFVYWLQFELLF